MSRCQLTFIIVLLSSCGAPDTADHVPHSESPHGSRADEAHADSWGQIIEAPPALFFAADLSENVRHGLTNTLLAATAEWGNYGPLEYWVLGADREAASARDD